MNDLKDRDLRKYCLEKAIESAYNSERGDSIIKRAKDFEEYVKGAETTKE